MSYESKLFAKRRHPYYLVAPEYRQDSGGVRAMHYLCHALNISGEEAYVFTDDVNLALRTPTADQAVYEKHASAGLEPIVVYPEIVSGNPIGANHVVRYLLAVPGLLTREEMQVGSRDLIYTFGPTLVPEGWVAKPLRIPLVDVSVFNAEGVNDDERSGSAVFIHRYLDRGGEEHPVTHGAIEISYRVEYRGPEELAAIFRQVRCLYVYEYSAIVFEALLCGCPVVFIPNDISYEAELPDWFMGGHGVAWGVEPEKLARAQATVGRAVAVYAEEEATFWTQLQEFIATTQAHVAASSGQRGARIDSVG